MANGIENRLEPLIGEIMLGYEAGRGKAPEGAGCLPNREVIIDVAHKLRQLLFPGYFGDKGFLRETQRHHVGEQLSDVHEALTGQIVLAFRHQANQQDRFGEYDAQERASQLSIEFLSKIPKVREYIATDVEATFDGDPAAGSRDEVIFSYPGIFAMSVHRFAHELYLLSTPLIPRIMSEYAHSLTGIDIHPGAEIGRYFCIDHGTGVVIGETTVIGDHGKIYQGVTLGALSTRGGQLLRGVKRHPTLEDNVTVYSGASILGGETVIGHSVVIGSNAFITRSVPAGTKVSIKNPDLLFKGQAVRELKQKFVDDWVI